MVILAEDGEGVCSFHFFCALSGLRLTHTTSRFGDKVALLEAFSSLGSSFFFSSFLFLHDMCDIAMVL